MTHWPEHYIGKPWENGAQGPDSFDCWGFVRHVFKEQRGIDLAPVAIDADHPLAVRHAFAAGCTGAIWQPVTGVLEEFDVALLSQSTRPDHVGVWTYGGLLHCVRGSGVIFETRASLKRSHWNVLNYYRWVGP